MITCEHTDLDTLERDCREPATRIFDIAGRPTGACESHLPSWAQNVEELD